MNLTQEQFIDYLTLMRKQIEKVSKEDHIIHGFMIYVCKDCNAAYIMNLEKGLEDPADDAETGNHKPVPFGFPCVCCGGEACHILWDHSEDLSGKDYRSYTEMVNSPGLVFRNFFWNDPESDCGFPIIFEPDGWNLDIGLKEKGLEERHVVITPTVSKMQQIDITKILQKIGTIKSTQEIGNTKDINQKPNREYRRHGSDGSKSYKRPRSNEKNKFWE